MTEMKDDDRFWQENLGLLREAAGFSTLTPQEMEAELDAIKAEPLTPDQIESMVRFAVDGPGNTKSEANP